MTDGTSPRGKQPARIDRVAGQPGSLWAIVLSGGEGTRLRPLVRHVCGDERPKQYVPLLGSRSLLQQTIDRVSSLVPPERTVLVTMRSHIPHFCGVLGALGSPRVLAQPEDRGTAAAILLGAHWVLARDPHGTVIVFPSDHLVVEEGVFMAHVAAVGRFVRQHAEWLTLLGAQPTEPESEYGWIEAGPRAGWTTEGPVYRALRFWEKPAPEMAANLFVRGCLWNTFVIVAAAESLAAVGADCVPELNDRMGSLAAFFDTDREGWAMSQAYRLAPRANFSQAVLHRCPRALAVSKLPPLTWCDVGSPARLVKSLTRLGISPPWLSTLPEQAAQALTA